MLIDVGKKCFSHNAFKNVRLTMALRIEKEREEAFSLFSLTLWIVIWTEEWKKGSKVNGKVLIAVGEVEVIKSYEILKVENQVY